MSKDSFNNDQWLASYIGDLLGEESPPKSDTSSTQVEDYQAANAKMDSHDYEDSTESEPSFKESSRFDVHNFTAKHDTQVPKPGMVPSTKRDAFIVAKQKANNADVMPDKKSDEILTTSTLSSDHLLDRSDRKQRVEKLLRDSAFKISETTEDTAAKPIISTEKLTGVKSDLLADKPQAVAEAKKRLVAKADSSPIYLSNEWIDGRPIWAQNRFDVLLFTVSKLTLAVPLISLGKIQKINNQLTPLFGQADWFMGVLPTDQGKLRCVDTALFVMPERYKPEFRDAYRFIISIDGLPWGLAVDEVKQPIQLQPASVNWRGVRTQRPWLAGTIKDHMCALIDIPKLGELLALEDKNSDKK